jgi:hypothetical protein
MAKKDNVCKHCGAVNQHFSFQCPVVRKPIKKSPTKIGDYTIAKRTPIAKKPKKDSLPELLNLAEIVFNKWIRNRDKLDDFTFICISCNSAHPNELMDAGHFRPKTISSLRFDENNINGECQKCNRQDIYHLIGYRENLIKKIGLDKVLELESVPFGKEHKWDRQELLDIIKKYKL